MQKADLILKGNTIFTGLTDKVMPGFVAVKDNKILAVSDDKAKFEEYMDRDTKVYDYDNELIMSSFYDSHTHLILAGMYKTFVNLGDAKSEEEAAKMVGDFAQTIPNDKWIIGFNWYHVFWDEKVLPTKFSLDKYVSDRPIFLINAEAHGAWVNSKALEVCGIDKNTVDPDYGHVEKLENGDPSGFLYEAALGLVAIKALQFTKEQEKTFTKKYMESAARFGITAVNDMQPYFGVNLGSYEAFKELEDNGELNIRIHSAPDLLSDMNQAEIWRSTYKSEKRKVILMKQFLDGVPTTYTALMIEEYSDKPGDTGTQLSDIDAIRKQVLEAHRRGFSVRLHACGDRSVRIALDCFEAAIKKYGKNEARHGIEHIECIHPDDIPRFKELGVIPSMQPEHLALTQKFEDNPYVDRLGKERSKMTWPLKTLLDTAGVLAIGTDCPVVDNDPFLEIYRAVTRVHNDGKPEGGWNPSEKLTMSEILRSYTYGSAYGTHRENELGTLEVGKLADIVVLDRNLFETKVEDIRSTKVKMTIMDGKIIYKAE
jgi:predicted amidohydrolase YtcJ